MKKLLLLCLVLLGGVMQMSAAVDIYLRNNIYSTQTDQYYGWNYDVNDWKFTYVETSNNEDIYTFNINASSISSDIQFRLHISGWAETLKPSQGKYELPLSSNNSTGYTINSYWDDNKQGSSDVSANYFEIKQSTIHASEYKITLYKKNSTFVDNGTGEIWMYVEIVSMPATVSALGYSTFSCDRALDLDNASTGLTAYKASVNSNNVVVLTKVTGKVAASTGLLLAGTSGTIPVVTTSEASAVDGNLLKPSVSATEVAASNADDSGIYHYFLAAPSGANIGFYNIASTQTSGAGKAYLETTTALAPASSSARVAWIFDGETTGINAIDNGQLTIDNNAPMYNLAGQRVNKSYKGVVIVNGKKMLNK